MTAQEIATKAVFDNYDCADYQIARSVLAALKAAGYAIVELPEPDENGRWQTKTDVANKIWADANPLGDGARVCTGIPGYEFAWRRPESARAFGLALLAAADAAEVS